MDHQKRDKAMLFFDQACKFPYEIAVLDLPLQEKEKLKRERRIYYKAWERISENFGKANSIAALADAICFLPINICFDALTLYQIRGEQLHGEFTFNSEVTEEHYDQMLKSFRDMTLAINQATTLPGKVVMDHRNYSAEGKLVDNEVLVLNVPDVHQLPEQYRTGIRAFEERFPYTVGPQLTISIALRKRLYGVAQMLCLINNEDLKRIGKDKLSNTRLRPFSTGDVEDIISYLILYLDAIEPAFNMLNIDSSEAYENRKMIDNIIKRDMNLYRSQRKGGLH